MKSPIKVLILVPALLVGLPALAWSSTFLYWHLRITRAVHILETHRVYNLMARDPLWSETCSFLRMDSCRTMPYLVRALHRDQDSKFLGAASYIVSLRSADVDSVDCTIRAEEWSLAPPDSPDEIRRGIALIDAWWEIHRSEHPWWRVWSSDCGAAR